MVRIPFSFCSLRLQGFPPLHPQYVPIAAFIAELHNILRICHRTRYPHPNDAERKDQQVDQAHGRTLLA